MTARRDLISFGIQQGQIQVGFLSRYHDLIQVSPLAVTGSMSRRADDIYWQSPAERREWGIMTKR